MALYKGTKLISGTNSIAYDDTALRVMIANRVEKEYGKSLSTNDYTDSDQEIVARLSKLTYASDEEVKAIFNLK